MPGAIGSYLRTNPPALVCPGSIPDVWPTTKTLPLESVPTAVAWSTALVPNCRVQRTVPLDEYARTRASSPPPLVCPGRLPFAAPSMILVPTHHV